MKINLHSLLGILMGALFAATPPAMAQTPDGETPANEGVCDDLVGSTPGLYGLCVAFCEAQDAEATFNESTGELVFAEGSRPSNPKILALYDKKKALGDPPMPCVNIVADQCDCWTPEELSMVADDTYPPQFFDGDLAEVSITVLLSPFGASIDGIAAATVDHSTPVPTGRCLLESRNDLGIPIIRSLFISAAKAETCRQSIRDEVSSRGLP